MKNVKIILIIILLVVTSACSKDSATNSSDAIAYSQLELNFENDTVYAREVFDVINDHRQSIGENALQWNHHVENVATGHSAYMADLNKASHDNFFERSDYLLDRGADLVSENIAFGYNDAESVLNAWLHSPSHKDALEGDYTHTGIGVVLSDLGIVFITQIFTK